jgi:hypothetical protein
MTLMDLFRGFQWWISAIEIPVFTFLFILINKNKKENDEKIERVRNLIETNYIQLKDCVSNYKLEVAKSYASITSLKEVEKRLVSHLLRIEGKISGKI